MSTSVPIAAAFATEGGAGALVCWLYEFHGRLGLWWMHPGDCLDSSLDHDGLAFEHAGQRLRPGAGGGGADGWIHHYAGAGPLDLDAPLRVAVNGIVVLAAPLGRARCTAGLAVLHDGTPQAVPDAEGALLGERWWEHRRQLASARTSRDSRPRWIRALDVEVPAQGGELTVLGVAAWDAWWGLWWGWIGSPPADVAARQHLGPMDGLVQVSDGADGSWVGATGVSFGVGATDADAGSYRSEGMLELSGRLPHALDQLTFRFYDLDRRLLTFSCALTRVGAGESDESGTSP